VRHEKMNENILGVLLHFKNLREVTLDEDNISEEGASIFKKDYPEININYIPLVKRGIRR
jgi:hypothetical protein